MSPITPIPDPHTYAARFAATVAALRDQLGGRAAMTPGAALAVLPGAHPDDPTIAANRRRARGTYPFRTVRVGGELVVLLGDIAAALLAAPAVVEAPAVADTLVAPDDASPEPAANDADQSAPAARRRRGRPRLTASASAQAGEAP